MTNILLTGDRPTGKLHLGHYVGSLMRRIELQNKGDYEKFYIMIADTQALGDNSDNVAKIRESIMNVALDYLSVGIDPNKVTIFIQSQVPELTELTCYYMNVVTLARVLRNPTVKEEMAEKEKHGKSLPVGFALYPISQAADITAFGSNIVPVGEDQLPMIEQTREIVRAFNNLYGETLVEPNALLPEKKSRGRLVGIDGKNKMSKSLDNCIYLSDDAQTVKQKVMSMYTDPNHIKASDPGQVEGNTVFTYLDALATDEDIKKYSIEYDTLDQMKAHYSKGGLGDVKVKKVLVEVINNILEPFRQRRAYYEQRKDEVYNMLVEGGKKARKDAQHTLQKVRKAMGIDYSDLLK